jgi:DNA polymerase
MPYIKKLDIFDLAKKAIEEEGFWGETELALDKTPAAAAATRVLPSSPEAELSALKKTMQDCHRCPLGNSRIKLVFGAGSPQAELMFVGEGPGYDEDRQGEPFVGRAGQLLNKIIEAMGLKRPDVYIANVVKCHPVSDPADVEQRGNDRPPSPQEVAACLPCLEKQIDIIKPKVICALGNSAVHHLLKLEEGITKLRGRFFEYRGIKLMPTYHPAALLRNPTLKKDTWADIKQIMAFLADNK